MGVKIIGLFFICITSYVCAMEEISALLHEQIGSIQESYREYNTPNTLDDILHLPIQPKNKYAISISSEISRMSSKNYDLLCEKYEDKKDILWTFVRLP